MTEKPYRVMLGPPLSVAGFGRQLLTPSSRNTASAAANNWFRLALLGFLKRKSSSVEVLLSVPPLEFGVTGGQSSIPQVPSFGEEHFQTPRPPLFFFEREQMAFGLYAAAFESFL